VNDVFASLTTCAVEQEESNRTVIVATERQRTCASYFTLRELHHVAEIARYRQRVVSGARRC
jgi:hypothetical protein